MLRSVRAARASVGCADSAHAAFVRDHIIRVTPHAFDDFAASGVDRAAIDKALGL